MMSMARQYANCLSIGAGDDLDEIWSPLCKVFGTDHTQITAFEDGSWCISARHHGDTCKIIADDEMRLVLEIEKARINYPIQMENVVRELTDEFRRLDPAAMRRAVKCAG